MQFKKYETEKAEDGSYIIKDVPIFTLGVHRDFNYDEKWFKKVEQNHIKDEESGYYPSVIIGHHKDGENEEKPANGFFNNLRLQGKNIIADLIKIPQKTFEAIKNRNYPHRSIEVVPKKAKITALALLGGSTPYHKLPILETQFQAEDGEVLTFSEDKDFEKDSLISEIIDKVKEIFSSKFKEEHMAEEKKFSQADLDRVEEESKEQFRENFKEKYGAYPEDLHDQNVKFQKEQKKAKIENFCENLKKEEEGKTVAPVVVDDIVKPFLAKHDENDHFEFVKKIVEKVKEGKFFADLGEHGSSDEEDFVTEFDNIENVDKQSLAWHKKAIHLAEKESIPYEEALQRILNESEVK